MAWEYETFGPDGQCKLFGVNIFDYKLANHRQASKSQRPDLSSRPYLRGLQVEINGQIHRFAAGEFSNCVVGFYLGKELTRGA